MKARWIWTVVCIAAVAASASAASPPPPPPANPEIVYAEAGQQGNKIVAMNSDGSNKTVVWQGGAGSPVAGWEPVFSPDAKWIAFTITGTGLYRLERATGVATILLTNAQCGSPCFLSNARFSPTGDRIAVIGGNGTGGAGALYWVLTVPVAGGNPVTLHSGPAGLVYSDVQWSTDETRIALLERREGLPNRINVVDLQTQAIRTIIEAAAGTTFVRMDWARNNVDRVAFDMGSSSGTDRDIWTVDFTATTVSPPVLAAAGAYWPSFSPDSSYLVARRKVTSRRYAIAKRNLGTGVWTDLGGDSLPDWKR